MAIFDTDLDYTKLIQFTEGTLQLASFVQIRNAFIQRMKDLYGNDIDVSPASADGQYINSISLLVNNILQTMKKGNDSLDPAVATGQYLDTLCSYNNITRRTPTASTVNLYLYNSTGAPVRVSYLTFMDKNNTLWVWDNGGDEIEIPVPTADNPAFFLSGVVCQELGPVSAPGTNKFYTWDADSQQFVESVPQEPKYQTWNMPGLYASDKAGTIFECVENIGLYVWQYDDAFPGDSLETDEALRSRRYQMLGNTSVSVLEGLKGSLLSISQVKDAYIFNNRATGDGSTVLGPSMQPIADGCSLKGHSIYVAIRLKKGAVVQDETIGKAIYEKLTPGISTSPYKSLSAMNYVFTESEPRDWDFAKERYCRAVQNDSSDFTAAAYYEKLGDETHPLHYQRILVKPSDWGSAYATYYKMEYNSAAAWDAAVLVPEESKMMEVVRTESFSDFIYWKQCVSIAPPIEIEFSTNTKLYNYPAVLSSHHEGYSESEKAIVQALKKATIEGKISEFLPMSTLLPAAQQSDRQKEGMPTFFVIDGHFELNDGSYITMFPADLRYFDYSDAEFSFEYDTSSGKPTGHAMLTIG